MVGAGVDVVTAVVAAVVVNVVLVKKYEADSFQIQIEKHL